MSDYETRNTENGRYSLPRGMHTSKVVPRLLAVLVLTVSTTVYAKQIAKLQSTADSNEFEINAMLQLGKHRWNIRDRDSAACLASVVTEVIESQKNNKDKKDHRAIISFKGTANFHTLGMSDIEINLGFDDFLTMKKVIGKLSTAQQTFRLSSSSKRSLKIERRTNDSVTQETFPNAQNIFVKRDKENQYALKFPFRPDLAKASTFPDLILEKVRALPRGSNAASPAVFACTRSEIASAERGIKMSPFIEKLLR